MAVVLVTRPVLRAQKVTDRLRAAGHEAICEPLLDIVALITPRPFLVHRPVLVLTSATTLSVLQARRDAVADLLGARCYCVGDETAAEAQAFGFQDVISARGDGESLANLVLEREGNGSPILHIGGLDVSPQPALALRGAGREVLHWPVYEARPVLRFSQPCRDKLAQNAIDAVLFFSVRTAQTFVNCIQAGSLEPCCAALFAVGSSEAVVRSLAPLPFGRVAFAPEPSAEALWTCFSSLSCKDTSHV